jgi:hypothetical protein
LGECLLELPCETDDALQQKKIFVNIFPKLASGGKSKNFFPDIQKRGQKNLSGQKPVKLKVKKFFRTYTSSIIGQKIFFGQIPVKICMKPLFF